jgi:hypothetical protein
MAAQMDAIADTQFHPDAERSVGRFTAVVDGVSEQEWNSLLDGFADATIYQTWAYGAVSWGEKQLSHLVLRQNAVPVAMAQVRIVSVPLLRSGIAYVRWGPVCARKGTSCDPTVWQAAIDALVLEYVERRGLTLRVLPNVFNEDAAASAVSEILHDVGLQKNPEVGRYQTLRVDLRPPLETIRRNLAHKWRNQLNAAERNQLDIGEGTDAALYAEFAALYREMMARKRFDTTVSVDEFQQIQERLSAEQKMVILIARQNGCAMSGLVASTIGASGVYLLGATGDEGMKAKGAYLLQWHMLRRLKEQGCEWYDLGGINAETNPGVYHFKQGLAGHEVLHIGGYDLHRNRLSKLGLGAAERLRRLTRG